MDNLRPPGGGPVGSFRRARLTCEAFEPEFSGLEGQDFVHAKLQARPPRRRTPSLILGCTGTVSAARGRDEVGDAERLRPVATNRRALHQADRVRSRASDGRRQDRSPGRRDRKEAMRAEQRPAPVGGAGKPLRERGSDPGEFGWPARDRHHRESERAVDRVEVEHVEAADHGPVHKDGPDSFEGAEGSDEPEDPLRPVRPIHAHLAGPDPHEVLRKGHHHGREGGVAVRAGECSVIDADELRMRFAKRPPQR